MEGTATTMAAFLENVGSFFTQSLEWTGSILDTVVESLALLVMVVGMPIVGFAYGLLGRLFQNVIPS